MAISFSLRTDLDMQGERIFNQQHEWVDQTTVAGFTYAVGDLVTEIVGTAPDEEVHLYYLREALTNANQGMSPSSITTNNPWQRIAGGDTPAPSGESAQAELWSATTEYSRGAIVIRQPAGRPFRLFFLRDAATSTNQDPLSTDADNPWHWEGFDDINLLPVQYHATGTGIDEVQRRNGFGALQFRTLPASGNTPGMRLLQVDTDNLPLTSLGDVGGNFETELPPNNSVLVWQTAPATNRTADQSKYGGVWQPTVLTDMTGNRVYQEEFVAFRARIFPTTGSPTVSAGDIWIDDDDGSTFLVAEATTGPNTTELQLVQLAGHEFAGGADFNFGTFATPTELDLDFGVEGSTSYELNTTAYCLNLGHY